MPLFSSSCPPSLCTSSFPPSPCMAWHKLHRVGLMVNLSSCLRLTTLSPLSKRPVSICLTDSTALSLLNSSCSLLSAYVGRDCIVVLTGCVSLKHTRGPELAIWLVIHMLFNDRFIQQDDCFSYILFVSPSHSVAGYYGDGLNAIIVFAVCYMPESNQPNYRYIMDNLFK